MPPRVDEGIPVWLITVPFLGRLKLPSGEVFRLGLLTCGLRISRIILVPWFSFQTIGTRELAPDQASYLEGCEPAWMELSWDQWTKWQKAGTSVHK